MKRIILILICTTLLVSVRAMAQSSPDPTALEGTWQLDMTPENTSDANFAQMTITQASGKSFSGSFYREGVSIQKGQLNTQTGTLYAALLSEDGTGKYHSSFYWKDGKLYGTTHALGRGFLAVWTATKVSSND